MKTLLLTILLGAIAIGTVSIHHRKALTATTSAEQCCQPDCQPGDPPPCPQPMSTK